MTQPPTKGFGRRKMKPVDAKSGDTPAPPPRPPGEKREMDRAPTFKNAHIVLMDRSTLECVARNVSEKGCMVSAPGAENLPDKLSICLGPGSPAKPAKVIWREDGEAGLKFLPAD